MTRKGSARFIKHHASFDRITGLEPSIDLLCESGEQQRALFHEACVYHQPTRSVLITSNQLQNEIDQVYEATQNKHIRLIRIVDDETQSKVTFEEITFPGSKYAMLNGGVNFGTDFVLFCAQGSRSETDASGIMAVRVPGRDSTTTAPPQVIISSFYGLPFNSVNDVVVHPEDGSIWFTDPCYGHYQGIRNTPVLPNQVYRFDPETKSIRAVADGFIRPNGLCFSPNLETLYITDTGAIHGSRDVAVDLAGPSHIYAFDVVSIHGAPSLVNRRLFAYAPGRFPDGIKCDTKGNVYAGCGDGIEIWNPQGLFLGVIAIEGGVANFCFGEEGVIYACNETRFWKIKLNQQTVRGALLGI